MKFTVKAWSNGKARAGVLQFSNCPYSVDTPALLLTTRKGLPVFIPPDHLPSLPSPDSHLLQISPIHFLGCVSNKVVSDIGGLHQMLGLHGRILSAVPRDCIISIPEHSGSNRDGASFETPCGRRLIKPAEYMEMISCMRPNMWTTLADEVPAFVSEKRNRTSVDRTLRWLDDCLTSNLTGSTVFGSIVGGSSIEERQRCAQEVAKRNVSGYWIGGFGLGESMEERTALLSAVTESLPEEKPRHICGLQLPEEVLQGVAAGIDLFDSSYIFHLTLGGFALTFPLTFPLERTERHLTDHMPSSNTGCDGTKINLKSIIYRKDTSPIVDKCNCFTCQNHTKAYINHLFNVHEMLAQILLEIHNTHHYMGFFRSIRESIKEGTFGQYREKFITSRRSHLIPPASALAN
ncbi:unnamed protein product [Cuscuta campestris]|uniref:Queuine tRNA-ribosyltransferase accessory subunit 2 n=1 Tax=Cuscuta campestris TaxID=132261 RepID=A0A484M559_9ASTE|nr:unnamed protein product [Cuscuta campestris]